MSFRLVPKSVTLNYLEWRNGGSMRYFTEFHSFPGALRKSAWLQKHRHFLWQNICCDIREGYGEQVYYA